MRLHTPLAALCGAIALGLAARAGAQTTTAETGPQRDEDGTLVLNPFEVRTDRDHGFVAANTLAGGRLATNLADTPVAYSVITREFIEALGITELAEAAEWTTNTVRQAASNGGGLGDDVSNAPGTYEVRGATNGRQQRNFFLYSAPMDSYAVERFDFGRGPNAVLFGNGSLGGVSSTMTKQARFDRDFTNVSFSGGSFEKYRATLDTNQVITEKFAARLAGVWQDHGGWRDRQFDKNQAAFLTGTYKFSRDTTLRLEGERGVGSRNQTFSNISDQFSGWDGVSTFSSRLDTLPADAAARGISRLASNYIVYDPFSGQNAIMRYQNMAITQAGGATRTTPLGDYVQGPTLPGFNAVDGSLLHAIDLPANRFDRAIAGSNFRVPDERFTTAFDTHTIRQKYQDLQLTFDHRIGNVFIQAAVDTNRTRQSINTPDVRNAGKTLIDINENLPNGAPNPHFLQPYNDSLYRRTEDGRDADGIRLAIGTTKDWGAWGRYTFNVMGGYTETEDTKFGAYMLSIAQNPDRRRWGATGAGLGRTDGIFLRNYWNEAERPYDAPTSVRWVDPFTGVDKTITPIWALENDRADSFQTTQSKFTYAIAAMNAKFFKDRLVLMGAIRADDFYSYTRQQQHGGNYSATDWDGVTGYYRPDPPADYLSMTYTLKNSAGVVQSPPLSAEIRPRDGNGNPLPQYASDRFRDDYNAPAVEKRQYTPSVGGVYHVTKWLSTYVNYAETFNPPAIIQRLDSTFLQPTVAKGYDFGLRLQLFGGRLHVNALHYRNSEINNPQDHGQQSTINGILNANAVGDTQPGGRNIRDMPNLPGVLRDIQDRSADGYEFEVTANLTPSWRLTFNYGLPKVYYENSFQDLKGYLEKNDPVLRQIVMDAGGIFDADGVARIDTSIPVNDRSPDVTTAVNNYNNIQNTRRNFVDGKRLAQDQPNANIYTDYTFRTGTLRGLRLGVGWQYRGKNLIGNRGNELIADPNNPQRAIDDPNVGPYDPAYAPSSWDNVVATIGYTWKLKDRREIVFNLRINNVLDETGPIWASTGTTRPPNADYTSPERRVVPTVYTLRAPRNYYLTTTLKF